jgi:hypothetical protein
LEVFVSESVAIEVPHESFAVLIGKYSLAPCHLLEMNMVENVFQGRVAVAQGPEGRVENLCDVRSTEIWNYMLIPSSLVRDEETIIKVRVIAVTFNGDIVRHTFLDFSTNKPLSFYIEDIRATLMKKHAKDVVLIFCSIHPWAENIGSSVQMPFKFSERQPGHISITPN